MYGTRGSTAISRADSAEFGGNTTCLRIVSQCLPDDMALFVDGGTGFVEGSRLLLKEKIMKIAMIMTHWHHDHTSGILLAPHTYIPSARMEMLGPKEHGIGPEEVMTRIMCEPLHPVNFQRVKSRFKFRNLEFIGTQVLVIHPVAGLHLMQIHAFEKAEKEGAQLSLGKSRYPLNECLVVRMLKTAHPEYTVSYRFEERTTGRVFVFLTDHENTNGFPQDLLRHLRGADVLIQDCQYAREKYDNATAGFGHGTPDYCMETALRAEAKKFGLTHHDPFATDADVKMRLEEAKAHAEKIGYAGEIFACHDYLEIEI